MIFIQNGKKDMMAKMSRFSVTVNSGKMWLLRKFLYLGDQQNTFLKVVNL